MSENTEQQKVVRDGMVAVLVSPGYGAGWSTWGDSSHRQWRMFAPEVVAWVEAGKPGGEKAVAEMEAARFGDFGYCGGADDLEIEWITQGTTFEIDEYDGSESLRVMGHIKWDVA